MSTRPMDKQDDGSNGKEDGRNSLQSSSLWAQHASSYGCKAQSKRSASGCSRRKQQLWIRQEGIQREILSGKAPSQEQGT